MSRSLMITIKGLEKRFRRVAGTPSIWRRIISRPEYEQVHALNGIDLEVGQGQFFSLLGPNGAGKTTTVRILCTLLLPDAGTCHVAGYDVVKDQRAVRRNIGVSIRGERSVYWKLTGRQNLEYFASLYGLSSAETRKRIGEIGEAVDLADRLDDFVEHYSMGMKQRLAIGASLIHRPPVLVLDEPTIGLDPNGARALRSLLKELCRNDGVTILYTTHYMLEAEELSDRLVIIHNGEKVIEGAPAEVREKLGDNRVVEFQLTTNGSSDDLSDRLKNEKLVEEVLAIEDRPTVTTVRLRTVEPVSSVAEIATLESLSGQQVRSLDLVRPTLEDVFVSLTGSRITEAGDARSV